MKNFLLFLSIITIASCSSDDDNTPSPSTSANNTNTFVQDARLLGAWRADSSWDSTTATMYLFKGLSEIGDSMSFSPPSFNGNTPNPEIKAWYISGSNIIMLAEAFFWETENDSLYTFEGNHSMHHNGYAFGYSFNANQLILKYRLNYINGPVYRIGYYHKN